MNWEQERQELLDQEMSAYDDIQERYHGERLHPCDGCPAYGDECESCPTNPACVSS